MMLLEKVGGVSRVTRAWDGQTVACFATGPSLTPEQVDAVRAAGLHAVAVNDAYLIAPWADVVYWADSKWLAWHKDKPEFKSFKGQKCTIMIQGAAAPTDPNLYGLKNAGGEGLSVDPTGIMTGANSGHQAMNIAFLSGAKRILMLGYDCRQVNGRKHFFGDHPDKSEPPYSAIRRRYDSMIPFAAKMGVEIINCTPGSWIECFPMRPLESVLADTRSPALQA